MNEINKLKQELAELKEDREKLAKSHREMVAQADLLFEQVEKQKKELLNANIEIKRLTFRNHNQLDVISTLIRALDLIVQ